MKIALAKSVLRVLLLIFALVPTTYCHAATASLDDDERQLETDEDVYYEDAFSNREYTDTRPFFSLEALLGGDTLKEIEAGTSPIETSTKLNLKMVIPIVFVQGRVST